MKIYAQLSNISHQIMVLLPLASNVNQIERMVLFKGSVRYRLAKSKIKLHNSLLFQVDLLT